MMAAERMERVHLIQVRFVRMEHLR
jgi:hypothetical protein